MQFTGPSAGAISIDSILIYAPEFKPPNKLQRHASDKAKINKALVYFGISPDSLDLTISSNHQTEFGESHDQDENMMTKIRNWESLFFSDGYVTVLDERGGNWATEKSNDMAYIIMD